MAGASVETTLELWASSLRDVKARLRSLFRQERVTASAWKFLDGLLGNEPRKTGWMRAEAAGDPGPWRQQAILGRGRWDAEALRDIVRDYAANARAPAFYAMKICVFGAGAPRSAHARRISPAHALGDMRSLDGCRSLRGTPGKLFWNITDVNLCGEWLSPDCAIFHPIAVYFFKNFVQSRHTSFNPNNERSGTRIVLDSQLFSQRAVDK